MIEILKEKVGIIKTIFIGGEEYLRMYQNQNGQIRWRCRDYRCRSRIQTDSSSLNLIREKCNFTHEHGPVKPAWGLSQPWTVPNEMYASDGANTTAIQTQISTGNDPEKEVCQSDFEGVKSTNSDDGNGITDRPKSRRRSKVPVLVYRGKEFRKNYTSIDGIIKWTCKNYKCRAKIYTNPSAGNVIRELSRITHTDRNCAYKRNSSTRKLSSPSKASENLAIEDESHSSSIDPVPLKMKTVRIVLDKIKIPIRCGRSGGGIRGRPRGRGVRRRWPRGTVRSRAEPSETSDVPKEAPTILGSGSEANDIATGSSDVARPRNQNPRGRPRGRGVRLRWPRGTVRSRAKPSETSDVPKEAPTILGSGSEANDIATGSSDVARPRNQNPRGRPRGRGVRRRWPRGTVRSRAEHSETSDIPKEAPTILGSGSEANDIATGSSDVARPRNQNPRGRPRGRGVRRRWPRGTVRSRAEHSETSDVPKEVPTILGSGSEANDIATGSSDVARPRNQNPRGRRGRRGGLIREINSFSSVPTSCAANDHTSDGSISHSMEKNAVSGPASCVANDHTPDGSIPNSMEKNAVSPLRLRSRKQRKVRLKDADDDISVITVSDDDSDSVPNFTIPKNVIERIRTENAPFSISDTNERDAAVQNVSAQVVDNAPGETSAPEQKKIRRPRKKTWYPRNYVSREKRHMLAYYRSKRGEEKGVTTLEQRLGSSVGKRQRRKKGEGVARMKWLRKMKKEKPCRKSKRFTIKSEIIDFSEEQLQRFQNGRDDVIVVSDSDRELMDSATDQNNVYVPVIQDTAIRSNSETPVVNFAQHSSHSFSDNESIKPADIDDVVSPNSSSQSNLDLFQPAICTEFDVHPPATAYSEAEPFSVIPHSPTFSSSSDVSSLPPADDIAARTNNEEENLGFVDPPMLSSEEPIITTPEVCTELIVQPSMMVTSTPLSDQITTPEEKLPFIKWDWDSLISPDPDVPREPVIIDSIDISD